MAQWEERIEEREISKEGKVNNVPSIYPSNRQEIPN